MMDVDGKNEKLIIEESSPNSLIVWARWSPDGKKIVYSLEGHIYVIDITGQNRTKLTKEGRNDLPTWSPNGKRIMFVRAPNIIHVMDTDGKNVKKLREGLFDEKSRSGDQTI